MINQLLEQSKGYNPENDLTGTAQRNYNGTWENVECNKLANEVLHQLVIKDLTYGQIEKVLNLAQQKVKNLIVTY
jgi:hypothetical protein